MSEQICKKIAKHQAGGVVKKHQEHLNNKLKFPTETTRVAPISSRRPTAYDQTGKAALDRAINDVERINATTSLISTGASLVPLLQPIALPIRGISGLLGAGIDFYQSQDAFRKGDTKEGVVNLGTGLLGGVGALGASNLTNRLFNFSSSNIDEGMQLAGIGDDIYDISKDNPGTKVKIDARSGPDITQDHSRFTKEKQKTKLVAKLKK